MFTITKEHIRSFGRVKGRKLTPSHQAMYKEYIQQFGIADSVETIDPKTCFDQAVENCYLEIGFGNGEHVLHQAMLHPDIGFIAAEAYINGVVKLLRQIKKHKLQNLKVWHGDVQILIKKTPADSFQKIFILFPDPWPKKKHFKRRLIKPEFLDGITNIIKNNGHIQVATDHDEYCAWILKYCLQHAALNWQVTSCENWQTPPKNWIKTRYQKKAEKQGRAAAFLNFSVKK